MGTQGDKDRGDQDSPEVEGCGMLFDAVSAQNIER